MYLFTHKRKDVHLFRLTHVYLKLAWLTIFILGLSACSGLPDHLVKEAREIFPAKLKQQKQSNTVLKKDFNTSKSSSMWPFAEPYAKSEKWEQHFTDSDTEINAAESLYEKQIIPMIDDDQPEDAKAFQTLLTAFRKHLINSTKAAKIPSERLSFLVNTRNNAKQIFETATIQHSEILGIEVGFTETAQQAIKDYSNKYSDITEKISTLMQKSAAATDVLNQVTIQYGFHTDDIKTDYATFGDQALALKGMLDDTLGYAKSTQAKLDELYKSYTKILADQRIDYYVHIGRATWCEGEYCGGGSTQKYPPIKVDSKVLEFFDKQDQIANIGGSWGSRSFNLKIPRAYWDALKIDYRWNFPRGDDSAEYWVESTSSKAFHKYIEIVNDKASEGAWKEVSDDSFWNQNDNLGMAILTKPYGYYEEDILKEAQPAGMAMIQSPVMVNGAATGSNRHGEWRQNSSGQSFWHYYGMYSLMSNLMGPSRYSYNDWNGYNRRDRGRGYYGSAGQWGTWGSQTYTNDRYRNGDFAKRNPGAVQRARSGNLNRKNSGAGSIRTAGSATRGRGPSSGGK
ncbi:MAG: hypothetical protein ACJAWS_001122 [Oleiphilaceae bacterium]|jgi:hypothetical protein